MPPFDRRPKTPTVSRPRSGFDAPANSAKVARAPWERDDDDAFGPPPTLELSPGDAESEAKRMIYEKTHPLHEAIMQNAHLDHNRAMRRYASLMRRAWDPAARDIPVKPARVVGDVGISGSVPRASVRNAALRPPAHKNPKDELLPPVAESAPEPVVPTPLPEPPAEKPKVRGPRLTEQRPIPSETVVARAASDARVADTEWIENKVVERIDGARPLDPLVVDDRALGEQQARERGAAGRRSDPDALIPPHAINLERFAAAQAAIDARNDLSDTEKYVLLGLIGYEDISPDIPGGSFGGVTEDSFNKLLKIVSALRELEGKPRVSAGNPFELTIDELLDFQRAYLTRELDPASNFPLPGAESTERRIQESAQFILNSNILNRLGPDPLAFQIADSVFNYGTDGRMNILQYAITETIRQMTPRQRSLGGYTHLDPAYIDPLPKDKADAIDLTRRAVLKLASDPVHQRMFFDLIRLGRAYWTTHNGTYRGNNRWRIWGITK